MSYTEFVILMEVYDEEFTRITEYAKIPFLGVPPLLQCSCLCTNGLLFYQHFFKASTLWSPGLRVIDSLLSRSSISRGVSAGFVTHREFQYLISMADGVLLHLGYVLTTALHHQATTCRIISFRPYITWLVRGLNLLATMDQVMIVGWLKPVTTLTLRAMGLVTQGVIDNNLIVTNSVTQSSSSAPMPTPVPPDSVFPDNSAFNRWLMWSLQKIADHCKASSVWSSSLSHIIGLDTTDL